MPSRKKQQNRNTGKLLVEKRGGLALICKDCSLPFAMIENGHISIDSKHGSSKHNNILTISHLKMILLEAAKQLKAEPEIW